MKKLFLLIEVEDHGYVPIETVVMVTDNIRLAEDWCKTLPKDNRYYIHREYAVYTELPQS